MAFQFISDRRTSEIDNVSMIVAGNRDTIIFARSAQFAALGRQSHVLSIGKGVSATINGELYSGDGATIYGRLASSTYNDFTVGSTGVVVSAAAAAFSIAGVAMTLKNGGEIGGTTGVASTAGSAAISNYATISGAVGVSLNGDAAIIDNVGRIVGSDVGVTIVGRGGDQQITNGGLVSGATGTAINIVADGNVLIANDGMVSGRIAITLGAGAAGGTSERSIVNSGTITGLSYAVVGSLLSDSVSNAGHIAGRIDLSDGDDRYDGRDGTTAGLVGGGAGDDVIVGSLTTRSVLSGGSGSDELTGGSANDVLIGGIGADVLDGGDGIDTVSYRDSLIGIKASLDTGNNDDDDVYASIERLQGSGFDDRLIAGSTTDRLEGGDGNDVLEGSGNARLYGGAGNDAYYLSGDERVIEAANGGIDTVYTSSSANLADNVENLTLMGGDPDRFQFLTGNSLANTVTGATTRDVLDGGEGQDTLTGGANADTFSFSKAFTAANLDTITDFTSVDDSIRLFRPAAGLPSSGSVGSLSEAAFRVGASARDADDRIIYNAATGNLFFDIDGLGGVAQVQFAHLDGNPAVAYTDFAFYG